MFVENVKYNVVICLKISFCYILIVVLLSVSEGLTYLMFSCRAEIDTVRLLIWLITFNRIGGPIALQDFN